MLAIAGSLSATWACGRVVDDGGNDGASGAASPDSSGRMVAEPGDARGTDAPLDSQNDFAALEPRPNRPVGPQPQLRVPVREDAIDATDKFSAGAVEWRVRRSSWCVARRASFAYAAELDYRRSGRSSRSVRAPS